MDWLQSILFGIVSGFVELLPVSAQTHRLIFLTMAGQTDVEPALSLATRVGVLLALLVVCFPEFRRLRRERRLAVIPPKRRKRQPDAMALYELRFLKTAVWPVLLSFLLMLLPVRQVPLWVMSLGILCSGILVFLPRLMPSGNKDGGSVSGLDGILVGMGCGLAVLPGFSAMSGCLSVGQLRGCGKQFLLKMAMQLSIVSLLVFGVMDAAGVAAISAELRNGALMLSCGLATLTAFVGAWCGIALMRYLSVHIGFDGFAFYNWGAALFTFILFLTI